MAMILRSLLILLLSTLIFSYITGSLISNYNNVQQVQPPVWPGIQPSAGKPLLARGDCGGAFHCNGLGGTPPATLAEITLGNDQDFYDVSLVDGYNIAMSITPYRGSGNAAMQGIAAQGALEVLNLASQLLIPVFKAACPKAYSYAYDDPTSIATCTRGSYLVTFCPATTAD
ncbi:hypothetical protein GH714_022539 [Hevea brasiliensis]|uniref:Uncharacterized protein n=1 Tax=Hevea brasiliensis TaxID=3981 RepID=A0A6A6MWC0_HEVBR|nr:hypothetical protein GH714_022539 [Hevea brasiliensis]